MYNPLNPAVREDPYPSYRALREASPVYWLEILETWVLTRYEDIQNVLRDYGHFSSDRQKANNVVIRMLEQQQDQSLLRRTATILSADPPSHTRMRALVNKAFTPRAIEQMRPHIYEIAEYLLDSLPPGEIDVMSDFATQLPVIVIAEMLGVSPKDRAQFKKSSTEIAGVLGDAFPTQQGIETARAASASLQAYFEEAVADHRRNPRDDLLSALIQVEEKGDLLSQDELLATVVLLLLAGNETTTGLIGNGMLALIPTRTSGGGCRTTRASCPPRSRSYCVTTALCKSRRASLASPSSSRGASSFPGHTALCLLGAANHDPGQFEEPEKLDLGRADNHHIAFGYGIHFCLGAPLARVEGRIRESRRCCAASPSRNSRWRSPSGRTGSSFAG